MRIFLVLIVILLGLEGISSAADRIDPITPGRQIGPARLGMTVAQVSQANRKALCPVTADYQNGRAVWIETNTGGPCRTSKGITVGDQFFWTVREFGLADEIREDRIEKDYIAVWYGYRRVGIAFRIILVVGGGSFVQAIAVFPKYQSNGQHGIRVP